MIKVTNYIYGQHIEMIGEIGGSLWSDGWTLEKFRAALSENKTSLVVIDLKSFGGDVMEAYAIHDAIRNLEARVIVNIVGSSASAATIIASAADEVTITENSRYMVHNARTMAAGTAEQIGQAYELLRSIDEQIIKTYIKRTGKSRQEIEGLMRQERWLTAQEALEWGFVDRIVQPKITNNMTQEEIDALKAENEQLKQQIAELQKQIEQLLQEKEAAEAAEIEKELDEKVLEGRITNDVKDFWRVAYKNDKTAARNAINAIKPTNLAGVPKPVEGMTKNEAWEAYKRGKITAEQYIKIK